MIRKAAFILVALAALDLLIGSVPTAIQATPAPLPPGLVSWWTGDGTFDDLMGANDPDVPAPGFMQGKVSQALRFTGGGGMRVPHHSSFNANEITIDAWVLLGTATNRFNGIANKNASAAGSFTLYTGDESVSGGGPQYLVLQAWDNDGNVCSPRAESGDEFPIGEWVHVAATISSSHCIIYMDGEIVASEEGLASIRDNTDAFNIGSGLSNGSSVLMGGIDEMQFYNRALSYSEIYALYAAGADGKQRPCVDAPSGMVGWWRGENVAFDQLGANHGALTGATYASGKVGQAFNFDGSNDFVRVEHAAELDPNVNFSADAWVYWEGNLNPSAHEGVVMKMHTSGVDSWSLFIQDNASIYFVIEGQNFSTPVDSVPLNRWFHLALTYNGSAAKVYIDGLEAASVNPSTPRTVSSGPLLIGDRNLTGTPQHPFNGLIDEVEVYSRALSADEIEALYLAGNGGKCREGEDTEVLNGDHETTYLFDGFGFPDIDIRNFGGEAEMYVMANDISIGIQYARSLVRFDLADLPDDAVVAKAVVQLCLEKSASEVEDLTQQVRLHDLHRLTSSWVEGIGMINMGPADFEATDGASWNSRDQNGDTFGTTSLAWATRGGDFAERASASATILPLTTGQARFITWDVTSDVQGFLAGAFDNHGWILKDKTEALEEIAIDDGGTSAQYRTEDSTGNECGSGGDGTNNPRLTIELLKVSGSIKITKQVLPEDDNATGFAFTGTLPGLSAASPLIDDEEVFAEDLDEGLYSASETVTAGYDLIDISCSGGDNVDIGSDGDFDFGDTGVTIDLAAGENVECVFTNAKKGKIIIEKQTDINGSPGSFTFSGAVSGSISDNGQLTADNLRTSADGFEYTVTEAVPPAPYRLGSITCDDGSSANDSEGDVEDRQARIQLDPGETVKCIFTNAIIAEACAVDGVTYTVVWVGSDSPETKSGSNANEVFYGLGGNDTINGNGGVDCILGGDGNDTLNGGAGADLIYGGAGDDKIDGSNDADQLWGDYGPNETGTSLTFNDNIVGGNGNDRIWGQQGNDTINGGNDADQISGGDNNDNILGGNGNDVINGDGGTDTINGGFNTDACAGETVTQCEMGIGP